jgi:hypothetical protein
MKPGKTMKRGEKRKEINEKKKGEKVKSKK